MTLFKRLKPEFSNELLKQNIEYPMMVGRIIDSLENNEYVTEMPYGIVTDLKWICKASSPWDLFKEI